VELKTPRFATAIGSNLYAEDGVEYFSVFLVAVISATIIIIIMRDHTCISSFSFIFQKANTSVSV